MSRGGWAGGRERPGTGGWGENVKRVTRSIRFAYLETLNKMYRKTKEESKPSDFIFFV